MTEDDETGRATLRVFAIAALALLGLAFSATPVAERVDADLLDLEWALLRKFDPRPAPDDMIIVGLDDSTRAAVDDAAPWQEPVAQALARIAAARPRAIALGLPLPERSFEKVHAGLDRMMLTALAAARQSGPFVAVIDVDARTRSARPIFPPYLAVLDDARLSLGMLSRDVDGVTRRFSLTVPTEDGGYPTLAGRVCRALSKSCSEGLINYALGSAFRVVTVRQVASGTDPQLLERMFRNRIVMIGDIGRYSDRVAVPVNLAGWEQGGPTSPGIVVHAQALRTALLGAAPWPAAKPLALVVVTIAAFLVLMRRTGLALIAALLATLLAVAAATLLLRGGIFMPIAAPLLTLALAWVSRAAFERWHRSDRRRRLRETFLGRAGETATARLIAGKLSPIVIGQPVAAAVLAVDIRERADASAHASSPGVLQHVRRVHESIAAAVHRHGGMLDAVAADRVTAVFGALVPLDAPAPAAASAAEDILRALRSLAIAGVNTTAVVQVCMAASAGEVQAAQLAERGPLQLTFVGAAVDEARRLLAEATRSGQAFVGAASFGTAAGSRLSDFQHPACD